MSTTTYTATVALDEDATTYTSLTLTAGSVKGEPMFVVSYVSCISGDVFKQASYEGSSLRDMVKVSQDVMALTRNAWVAKQLGIIGGIVASLY